MNHPLARSSLAVVLTFLFAACSATTVQYVPLPDRDPSGGDPAKGRVYVMRPSSFGAGVGIRVAVDGGAVIGKTGPAGYLCWEMDPGPATIVANAENEARLDIDVEAGAETFVLQRIHLGWLFARNSLEQIVEPGGGEFLRSCSPPTVQLPDVAAAPQR